jgi:5-methyltetrahydropteroyltriglutamate--homocysteine methyltransferase
MAEGGYDYVAESAFPRLNVDALFLEYDSPRAGGFAPLKHVPPSKAVVLGLITTKAPQLEAKDLLRKRIDEASKYFPLEQMCVSTQCGFASTIMGNPLSIDEEERKLALVVDVARETWGEA